jgi:hypothetical protein
MAGFVGVIWGEREAEYFSREGWTGFSDLPVGQSHTRSQMAYLILRSAHRARLEG